MPPEDTEGAPAPQVVHLRAANLVAGAKRRARKRSLAATLKAAQRAGVAGATVKPDGSVAVSFGEAVKPDNSNSDELDQWMADHAD